MSTRLIGFISAHSGCYARLRTLCLTSLPVSEGAFCVSRRSRKSRRSVRGTDKVFTAGCAVVVHSRDLIPAALHKRRPVILTNPTVNNEPPA